MVHACIDTYVYRDVESYSAKYGVYIRLRLRLRVDGVAHALAHHEVADLVGARAPPGGGPRLLGRADVLAVEADGARQRQQRPGQGAAHRRRHHRAARGWSGGGTTVNVADVCAERALVHHTRRPPPPPPSQALPHQAPHDR